MLDRAAAGRTGPRGEAGCCACSSAAAYYSRVGGRVLGSGPGRSSGRRSGCSCGPARRRDGSGLRFAGRDRRARGPRRARPPRYGSARRARFPQEVVGSAFGGRGGRVSRAAVHAHATLEPRASARGDGARSGGVSRGPGYDPVSPGQLLPGGEERIAQARIELPPGAGLRQTDEAVRPFEEFLQDDPGVRNYQISVSGENNFDPNSPIRSANQAQAFINIEEEADPQRAIERISGEGREIFGEEAFQAEILQNGPPQGGLRAIITGGTEEEREEAAGIVSDKISSINSVINVRSDVSGGTPEIVAEVDPERSARLGLSPQTVSGALATLLGGSSGAPGGGAPGAPGGEPLVGDTPVSVSLPPEALDSVEEVRALSLAPGLTVGDIAEVTQVEAPAAKSRVDAEPAVTVNARIVSQDTQKVSTEAQMALANLNLPGDVEVSVGGENEDIQESFTNLFYSIIVALVLVFILLVVFFGSILVPLVILLAVPLTTAGAFGALLLTNTALSLPSLLGILLLIGIVVSNAILLVDFAIKARGRHEDADEAVVEAGRARLRPILMTALATIFALLPLALGLAGGGSGLISASLAITVIGGLATSTFLTLLVVPVGYSLLESARNRRKKRRYA
ncbi:MAG: efflux RND transporter permease subunit [Actinomycetota bacterium]|nr:efflux RND transporter permease subunit [Actinomycetota bacterium]